MGILYLTREDGTPVGVISFNGRTGAVVLLSSDVINALGYTPYQWPSGLNPTSLLIANASGEPSTSVNLLWNSATSTLNITGKAVLSDNVTIGPVVSNQVALRVGRNITGSAIAYGTFTTGEIRSDVTNIAYLNRTSAQTQAAAFVLLTLNHYSCTQSTIGAGSSVTTQNAFKVESSLIGATNNRGFAMEIPAGANRWGAYFNGTAQNYFEGLTGFGIQVPVAKIEIAAGTANTAPLRLNSGVLNILPIPGAFEFVTDKLYFVTTTQGRKEVQLNTPVGALPTATVETSAGAGATVGMTTANNNCGIITLVTGTGCSVGAVVKIVLNSLTYPNSVVPVVTLGAAGSSLAAINAEIAVSTDNVSPGTTFYINILNAPLTDVTLCTFFVQISGY